MLIRIDIFLFDCHKVSILSCFHTILRCRDSIQPSFFHLHLHHKSYIFFKSLFFVDKYRFLLWCFVLALFWSYQLCFCRFFVFQMVDQRNSKSFSWFAPKKDFLNRCRWTNNHNKIIISSWHLRFCIALISVYRNKHRTFLFVLRLGTYLQTFFAASMC